MEYDVFIGIIDRCKSLMDLERAHNRICREIPAKDRAIYIDLINTRELVLMKNSDDNMDYCTIE